MTAARVTIFSGPGSQRKRLSLVNGRLQKQPPENPTINDYRLAEFVGASGLIKLLTSMRPNEALSASTPRYGAPAAGGIALKAQPKAAALARSKSDFGWHEGPGLLILDYDGEPCEQGDLWGAVCAVCPQAAAAAAVGWYSASSYVYSGDAELTGSAGQRIYVCVSDATDVPRALKVLNSRLALAGQGLAAAVTKAGSVRIKHLFDAAMGEPARLDYAPAGADCAPPLESRRPAPVTLADGQPLDTQTYIPDLSRQEQSDLDMMIGKARAGVMAEAAATRAAWADSRCEAAASKVAKAGGTAEAIAAARDAAKVEADAAQAGTLTGDFAITLDDGAIVTAAEILADRKTFHGRSCLDPMNPGHRDGAYDAIIYSDQPSAVIYSLDDGGITYRLAAQRQVLILTRGQATSDADAIAQAIADAGHVFNLGGAAVLAPGFALARNAHRENINRFRQITPGHIELLAAPLLALRQVTQKGPVPADMPGQMQATTLHCLREKAPFIGGQAGHPVVTPQGVILDRPGHDAAHAIYLNFEPGQFTMQTQALGQAVARIWQPWSAYRWASPNDRAAMLAMVLTVPLRPMLRECPGLFMDAPQQGCGKTKAAAALAAIVLASPASPQTVADEVEMRKAICAAAIAGEPVIFYDNVVGIFNSSTLSAIMTSGEFKGRILGMSTEFTGRCRPLMIASGNNAEMTADFAHRWLTARIMPDATNGFSFDPQSAALADRDGIMGSIVAVWRAFIESGKPRSGWKATRFAEWDMVRDLMAWLIAQGVIPEGDPAQCLFTQPANIQTEAEGAFLRALQECYGSHPFTVQQLRADVTNAHSNGDHHGLFDAATGCLPHLRSGPPNSHQLGQLLRRLKERTLSGLKLVHAMQLADATHWKLVDV